MSPTHSAEPSRCGMDLLEDRWLDLEDGPRLRFQSFCAFHVESWNEHAKRWTAEEKDQFLDTFETFLHERVREYAYIPFRGRGRSRLVEHDPKAEALRVYDLLPEDFMTAYCQRFAGSWVPAK